tara:strand:- start:85372 stop:86424 length:1053 start_codon:yes stop_codon:yes gene_type:complete
MSQGSPRAWGDAVGSAVLRSVPDDFLVSEELGFELAGEGEHVFLYLQKTGLNTAELQQRLSSLSGVHPRDIGYSGMKDRNAVTRQWFSVGMAGRPEPPWQQLESSGDVQVLSVQRHLRKLRRGVHRANRFRLRLRNVCGERDALQARLCQLRDGGAPNYFGEQRFGRNGSTLQAARTWMESGGRRVSRARRGLYLSALRAHVFNALLGERVAAGTWNTIVDGDVCLLQGTRSHFRCEAADETLQQRAAEGDLHPALPLWGRGLSAADGALAGASDVLAECDEICRFLDVTGLTPEWRAARLLADDFCWQFCDDDYLQLDFALGAGAFATALLAEFVQYTQGDSGSDKGSE